ncbi:MAG: hypothetical protein IKF61_03765, partial [Firmicutes bacterium]|nr:hypothetical protein [Bacillota bacterium]
KLRADTLPGDRYTAAVEQNTVAVTEYLKRATDLEWQKYEIEEIGRQLDAKLADANEQVRREEEAIESYEKKAERTRTQLKDYKKLEYRRKVFNFKFNFDLKIFGIGVLALLVIYFIGKAAGAFKDLNVGLGIALLILIPALAVFAVQAVKYFRGKAEHEKMEDEATQKYSEEQDQLEKDTIESLNNDIKDFENIIKNHKNEKARLEAITIKEYEREIAENTESLEKIDRAIEVYYEPQALYPKYRSLIPVATMYGYFDSGRCIDLTGHSGAYGYYEKELRYKNITEDLDEILQKTEEAAGDQALIQKKVAEIKDKASKLISTVDEAIQKNLDANPDVSKISSRLKHSRELQEYRDAAGSLRHDYVEYSQSLKVTARRWF